MKFIIIIYDCARVALAYKFTQACLIASYILLKLVGRYIVRNIKVESYAWPDIIHSMGCQNSLLAGI